MAPMYSAVNHGFFKKWTPEMAYVLGYFAADGTMVKHKNSGCYIEFHSTDKGLIEMVKRTLHSEHRIGVRRSRDKNHKTAYRIQIGSKEMFEDLMNLGFTPSKSKTLVFPDVPSKYLGDFVRGYFDGDGCIYFKRLKFADRARPRWVVLSLFTSGSRDFLSVLHMALMKRGVQGGALKKKDHGCELVFSSRDSLALYVLMYNTVGNTGLRLPRKYTPFRKAMKKLYPNALVV